MSLISIIDWFTDMRIMYIMLNEITTLDTGDPAISRTSRRTQLSSRVTFLLARKKLHKVVTAD